MATNITYVVRVDNGTPVVTGGIFNRKAELGSAIVADDSLLESELEAELPKPVVKPVLSVEAVAHSEKLLAMYAEFCRVYEVIEARDAKSTMVGRKGRKAA